MSVTTVQAGSPSSQADEPSYGKRHANARRCGRVLAVALAGVMLLLVHQGEASGASAAGAGISAKVRSVLLKDAKRFGTRDGYRIGSAHDIQAVLTSEGIYVVALRGKLERICHRRVGKPCSRHAAPVVVTFWVNARTMMLLESERSNSYPDLASLGTPVHL